MDIFIITLFVGIGVGIIIGRASLGMEGPRGQGSNLPQINRARQDRKEEGKKMILTLFKEKEQITNSDVERLLGVSDATATNYLEELEQEEKVRQEGATGKYVFYTSV